MYASKTFSRMKLRCLAALLLLTGAQAMSALSISSDSRTSQSACTLPMFLEPLHARYGSQPVPRIIVPSMTDTVKKVVQQYGVLVMLVLPTDVPVGSKVEWGVLSGDTYIHHLDSGKETFNVSLVNEKMHTWRSLHAINRASRHKQAGTPTVAIYISTREANIRPRHMIVVTSLLKRLRHVRVLLLISSSYHNRADALLLLSANGMPLGVALSSTTVFRDAFQRVYDTKAWGLAGGGSGTGSDPNKTRVVQEALPEIIARYNITSMLDSSCGSMVWMPQVLENVTSKQPNFKFMGVDVVCSLIEQHKEKFASSRGYEFACLDYASQQLPCGYDLIFSRDSLQHVPSYAIWNFLNNAKSSKARYLLVGSYLEEQGGNKEIPAGEYFSLNLLKPPYNLPQPLEVVDEQTPGEPVKHLLLYDLRSLTWSDPLSEFL